MANRICGQLKKYLILFFLALLPITGGCMSGKMNVEVVVLNYNTQPVGELTIQGNYIGGYYGGYGPGGTGGKIYCCIDVRRGPAIVEWMYGGAEGASKSGTHDKATGLIPEPSEGYKFLGVHMYPDGVVEFTLTRDMPSEKKQGEP